MPNKSKASSYYRVLYVFVVLSALIIHTLIVRPIPTILYFGILISSPILLISVFLIFISEFSWKNFILVLLSLIIGISIYSFYVSMIDVYKWITSQDKISNEQTRLIVPLGVLTIALFLFFIKKKFGLLYGSIEIILGLLISYFRIENLFPLLSSNLENQNILDVTNIVVAIFLVVRGLDTVVATLKAMNNNSNIIDRIKDKKIQAIDNFLELLMPNIDGESSTVQLVKPPYDINDDGFGLD